MFVNQILSILFSGSTLNQLLVVLGVVMKVVLTSSLAVKKRKMSNFSLSVKMFDFPGPKAKSYRGKAFCF